MVYTYMCSYRVRGHQQWEECQGTGICTGGGRGGGYGVVLSPVGWQIERYVVARTLCGSSPVHAQDTKLVVMGWEACLCG